jgi:cobalt-zinc-cadmium efflux system outer membrane protein
LKFIVATLIAGIGLLATSGSSWAQDVADQTYSDQLGEPRTLEELLDIAEDNAPAIEQARERVGLGEAAIEGAERLLPYNPEIEGELGVGLSRVEVTLTQRLEVAGQRGLRLEAARQRRQALVAELAQAQWDVHHEVHRLYRLGLVAQERVDIEREILAFTKELFEVAQQRFEAGEEPRTSVIVAKAEVAKARQRLLKEQMSYRSMLRTLGVTVGWAEELPPQPAGERDDARPIPDKSRLVSKALAADPQLAVLDAQLEQARAELALQEREVWPDPVVGVGYERENLGSAAVEDKLLLIVGMPIPLWNQNQGEVAVAKARTSIVRQAIENRHDVLESHVLKQAETVQSAYRQAQIYEEEVLPALQTQLELLQEGFTLGELSLLDVMNARDRLLAVQRQNLGALHDYFVAVSELEEHLGTSIWDTDED